MSTNERHKKFKARGWQYVTGIGMNGNTSLEIWAKPDGSIAYWSPGSDDDHEDEADYIGYNDGTSGEEWKDAARRKVAEKPEDAFKILQGVTLPEGKGEAAKIIKPYLTWDAPYFVAAAKNNRTVKFGTLVTSADEVIPTLERYEGGRPVVAGPYSRVDGLTTYLDDRHAKQRCGYWRIGVWPEGRSVYPTWSFLRGEADNDPRPVLPMEYYGHKGRAAVRRECLTTAFDGCYERVRKIVDAENHPERMHVAAETPEFVIFGKPGIKDRITEMYGV